MRASPVGRHGRPYRPEQLICRLGVSQSLAVVQRRKPGSALILGVRPILPIRRWVADERELPAG